MKKYFIVFTAILMTLTMAARLPETQAAKKECVSPDALKLKEDMRTLWNDHVIWTHNYIVSAVDGLEDQEKVLERLLQNQKDIGNAIKPFYGEKAGNQLAELLTEHIVIAGKIVESAKAGNQAEVEKLNKEWYRNADDITAFLIGANPNWSEKELKELLYMHLDFVTKEAVARIQKDWNQNIESFDKGRAHIFHLADALSKGITKQFPQKF
ncbi:glycosyltransferase [Bacillus sp. Marseille-Q1617]|uniref:glycosyltransferase n=1 Tax=Bacillus sp. Marseille-Q1617 TaxID=2736887 RepID=UPI00158B64AB|nr:glycosyltransferase [Bacillus sp. Marseille-Q1617]